MSNRANPDSGIREFFRRNRDGSRPYDAYFTASRLVGKAAYHPKLILPGNSNPVPVYLKEVGSEGIIVNSARMECDEEDMYFGTNHCWVVQKVWTLSEKYADGWQRAKDAEIDGIDTS